MHVEVFVCKLVYGQSVYFICVYRDRNGAALRVVHHASLYKHKEFSCCPLGMYGRIKHCLSDDTRASGMYRATNRCSFVVLSTVRSCVLQIHYSSNCRRICFFWCQPERRNLWLPVIVQGLRIYFEENEESRYY